MSVLRASLCVLALVYPTAGSVGEVNNFWLIWERHLGTIPNCEGPECDHALYFSHLIDGYSNAQAQQFFGGMQRFVKNPQHRNMRLPQSPFCAPEPAELDELTLAYPDPTQLELAAKMDTLRGLEGVFVDLRGVRGPQAYDGQFGILAQEFLARMMTEHNIPILTREEAEAHPGNPILSMRYSPEVIGCRPWSVSLALSQRLLLARDPTIMIEGTTWSASAGQNEADVDFREDNAMEQVIIAFVEAYVEANTPKEPEVVEVAAQN